MSRSIFVGLALLVAVLSAYVLETARSGVSFEARFVGDTPVTTLSRENATGPNVVIAHGFAGSHEMMQAYGLLLAQAGYRVHMFDFEGHGAHPNPMSGDVTRIEGTTQQLVAQTRSIIDDLPLGSQVALLGHSMATDVLVRVAAQTDRVGPLVLLSAFSDAVTADHPNDMLLISGQYEPQLRKFGVHALQMVDPTAQEGDTVHVNGVHRSARVAPYVEHVAILQSRGGRADALNWINRAYDRTTTPPVPATGWALIALLAAITALSGPIARISIKTVPLPPKVDLSITQFSAILLIPMVATPVLASLIKIQFLPVLVADYLAVHLGIYGLVTLVLLRVLGARPEMGGIHPVGIIALLAWGIGVFGLALDRYGANFFPVPQRFVIIAALALGAVPFMIADSVLAWRASVWRRIVSRIAILVSLGIAVAIDLEGLLFLIMIAPVIVLFFLVHGTMGRSFSKQTGPLTAGVALGLILAWALGVSFPMFAVTGA